MSFSLYLKNKLSEKQISRNDFIAQLNLFNNEFENLDAITLSRWMNNKTTPSTYKQVLISHYFNDDLIRFLKKYITIRKEARHIKETFNTIMNKIESSYTNISYFHSIHDEYKYDVNILEHDEYNKLFGKYYMNFQTYTELRKIFNEKKIKTNNTCIIKRKNGVVTSHLSFMELDNSTSDILSNYFDTKIDSDAFINISHFEDKETYLFINLLLIYLFSKKTIYSFTCLIRSEIFDFLIALPCVQIGTTYLDNDKKLYLIKFDLLQLISNPFIRNLFIDFLLQNKKNLDCLLSKLN
ncbi:hypothetical protein NGM67_03280 [Photobacterium damselae]|uniref:hypothetical protein n=1 Tax=Photobacterium damselae TaxID=38293 RepID=UPI002091813A|nr:hypothetical protein [Photobacterium damselae]USR75071.1 hypothetical protein NGM67_03280 [Photobacterium damselae]